MSEQQYFIALQIDQLGIELLAREVARFQQNQQLMPNSHPSIFFTSPVELSGTAVVSAPERPRIVCICGSMRFEEEMRYIAVMESMFGHIVIMPHVRLNDPQTREWIKDVPGSVEDIKRNLDDLHLRKIDMADEIYVVDVDGYIGDSTRLEISYAKSKGKVIRYLSDPLKGMKS